MLSDNYRDDPSKNYIWSNGRRTKREDARSIWFSLETLKSFIYEIESAACKDSCANALGVRIYYARYPSVSEFPKYLDLAGVNPEYASRHTIFMVPTYWDNTAKQYLDFNPAGGCRGSFSLRDGNKRAMIFMPSSTLEEEAGATQNHGGLAPPPSATTAGTFPTTSSSF